MTGCEFSWRVETGGSLAGIRHPAKEKAEAGFTVLNGKEKGAVDMHFAFRSRGKRGARRGGGGFRSLFVDSKKRFMEDFRKGEPRSFAVRHPAEVRPDGVERRRHPQFFEVLTERHSGGLNFELRKIERNIPLREL